MKQRLLERGINVAVPEIDEGVDLLANWPQGEWVTIQVNTTEHATHAGLGADKSRPILSWTFPMGMSVDLLALVNLEHDAIYLYPLEIAEELAQQSAERSYRLYFDIGEYQSTHSKIRKDTHDPYLLENFLGR